MQSHSKTIVVTEKHLDQNNHVNNIVYLQWAQQIAREHWLSLTSSEIVEKYFWVVLSHHIEYKAAAVLNDTIKLITFVPFAEGVKSTRIVEMYNAKTNKLIAKTETHWCLMSQETNRPARIPEEIIKVFE